MIPRRRTGHLLTITSAAAALALGLTGCGGGSPEAGNEGDDTIGVVTSTDVWGSVVSAVGGNQVSVKAIIDDPSGDPHSYQATAEDAADVQDAQLIIYNGGGYDDFFTGLAEQAPDTRTLVAFDIAGKAAEDGHGAAAHGDEHEDEHGHAHGAANEHVWYDVESVGKVADQVATQLSQLRPAAAQTFTENATALRNELDQLAGRIEQIGAERAGTPVLATEPVAHYLLADANLHNVTPEAFSRAVEEETDVPIAAQNQVNQLLSGKQVDVVVHNVQTVTPVTEQVVTKAGNAGIPVVPMTETLPEGETSYIAWMNAQVDELAGALNVS